MQKFIRLMAEILETGEEELSPDTDFRREIEDFSSLIGFSMIITIEEEYGVKISVPEFLKCKTLGDLYAKISR